jgi:hypothetical protein
MKLTTIAFVFWLVSVGHAYGQGSYSLTQTTRIDGEAADLTGIAWLALGPDGNVAALQSMISAVKVFNPNGKLVRTIGRKGAGPGEYQTLGLGGWTADTLWLYDTSLDRITLIGKDGRLIRTEKVPSITGQKDVPLPPFGYSFPLGRPKGFLVREAGPAPRLPNGQLNGSGAWLMTDLKGIVRRVVGLRPAVETSLPVNFPNGRGIAPIPFVHKPLAAISPDGRVLASIWTDVKGSPRFILDVYDAQTGSKRQTSFPFKGVPITKRMSDSAISKGMQSARRPEVRKAIDVAARSRIPPVLSPVKSVFVDNDGRVWIGLRPASSTREWRIVRADGSVVGNLTTKANVELRSAQGNTVVGVETDEDDVESIIVFKLVRPR